MCLSHISHRSVLGAIIVSLAAVFAPNSAGAAAITEPILFVTQIPIRDDYTTIGSVFGNQRADMDSVGRGGDLWMRYSDGTLKNLTAEAGYGIANGFQGANAIAVRDPSVHWSGAKALFSMVVGAPAQQYDYSTFHWQIYEITGLGKNDTPVIGKVPNQPANYNNVTPIYGTDERIIFTSDRPHNGAAHLYPQRDEYEEAPTVTGLWSLNPQTGELLLLNHAPSGAFTPTLDSFGRVIFTRWDHLQRDQQADSDREQGAGYSSAGCAAYCTFNFGSEARNAVKMQTRKEIYPEPRGGDQVAGTNLWGHTFNHFMPWQINEDGTEEETINHLGRHELSAYIPPSLNDDGNLYEYYGQDARANSNPVENFLQIREDPTTPGRYFAIDAPEFRTHASGQVISIDAAPTVNPDISEITYWTHRDTASYDNPSADHSGHYRDPLPLSSGTIVVAHTGEIKGTDDDTNSYDFRLKPLVKVSNGYWRSGESLTPGISKTVWYWSPDYQISYQGLLWELQPVEVIARTKPPRRVPRLPDQETTAIETAGVQLNELRAWLTQHKLALIVSRNLTQRDDFDHQQPFNLRVADGEAQTLGAGGKIYPIKFFQLFQGDLVRGIGGVQEPWPGRRVLPQYLHEPAAANANRFAAEGPASSLAIAPDGSVAAFVPAQRALSWQTTDVNGVGVVRERMWLSFQPGEIRVCTSCHGVNQLDQSGNPSATNIPLALTRLMQDWKSGNGGGSCQGKPAAPALNSPMNDAVFSTRRVTLDWDDVKCATKYQVDVRRNSSTGALMDRSGDLTHSAYTTKTLARRTTYMWSVKACNVSGCTRSAWQTFKLR